MKTASILTNHDPRAVPENALLALISRTPPASFHYGSLAKHLGRKRAEELAAAYELGRRSAFPVSRPVIACAQDVFQWSRRVFQGQLREELWLLALDSRAGLLAARQVAAGAANALTVRTRDILRLALEEGAVSIVLVHNHPSGSLTPSEEDCHFTRVLQSACNVVGIPLADHLIVTETSVASVLT
jgi:DNA repair protein RadC